MRKDYHIHPVVLGEADRFDAFVRRAVEKNIGEICVTDHMPLSVSRAADRIEPGRVRDYITRVRELAKEYSGIIEIKCGIEIDYHPSVTDEILRVLDAGEFDFVLASSHMHVFISDLGKYTKNDFARAALENSISAVETGLFSAVAHPDMYRFVFENPDRFPLKKSEYCLMPLMPLVDELIDNVKKRDLYLEINPHLAEKKNDIEYVYPQKEIVHLALEKGVKFSYGSDAHEPSSVGAFLCELENHPVYGKALEKWEGTNEKNR